MKKCTVETTDLHALHALLDSLTDGDHVKTTWELDRNLTSIEVVRTEEVTVTRDDEEALHALLDSLEDGQEVTAEWRSENGAMVLTGLVGTTGYSFQEVKGYARHLLRGRGTLHHRLHSVTARRTVVHRWEREKEKTEHPR